jgi:2-octaprenylphenol hydroxylase
MKRARGGRRRSALVIGGGPVGLATAALLSGNGHHFDVRLIDPRPAAHWDPADIDLRVYALSRASQHILAAAGAWDSIVSRRAGPYRRMVVCEGDLAAPIGHISFDSAEIGEPDLGHIVEDRLIRACLREQLAARSNVDLCFGTGLAALHVDAERVEATTDAGQTLRADVVVAADGSASTVRTLLGFSASTRDYDQAAVVAHVASAQPHGQTAWQRFLASGPVALLPLADGRSSVVWSTGLAQAEALLRATDTEFLASLEQATGAVLGEFRSVGPRASFPLRVLHAHSYSHPRVALIGDAAHTVHPLAGQGMNLGMLDAAVLAEVLSNSVTAGDDPGDLRVLKRYERRQKGRNLRALFLMDALHRGFTQAGPLLAPLRVAGLSAVDRLPGAKRVLMYEALGLSGDLPESARRRIA